MATDRRKSGKRKRKNNNQSRKKPAPVECTGPYRTAHHESDGTFKLGDILQEALNKT